MGKLIGLPGNMQNRPWDGVHAVPTGLDPDDRIIRAAIAKRARRAAKRLAEVQ